MATYTNTIPSSLAAGDVINFTASGTYTLPRAITATAELNGAAGGKGGDNVPIKITQYYGGAGGRGGKLVCPNLVLSAGNTTIALGAQGAAGGQVAVSEPGKVGYYYYGTQGGTGGDTYITSSASSVVAAVHGGGGGAGAQNTGNGATGSQGAAYVLPSTGSTATTGGSSSATSGTITLTISNVAPSAPTTMNLPATIKSGAPFTITWSGSSDPNGNLYGYILERSINGGSSWTQIYQGVTAQATDTLTFGAATTVMYRVKAYDTGSLQSPWLTSASKAVVNNRAPSAPPSMTVPLTPIGGEKFTVSWAASTDADSNLSGYRLERSVNGAAYSQIYQGTALSYQDTITKGWNTVAYRVLSYDAIGDVSGYTTSATRTVDNNTAPVITCSQSGNLGSKSTGFSITYSVSDANGDAVTVTEAIDGVAKRQYAATLGAQQSFDVTGDYFMRILNGSRTLTITAADAKGKSSVHTLTFTKAVYALSITLSEPMETDALISKTVMSVMQSMPLDAEFEVLVTNNANDTEPVWEDMTTVVKTGRNFVFTNGTAQNGFAFNFRITARRGASGVGGHISQIGGAFE